MRKSALTIDIAFTRGELVLKGQSQSREESEHILNSYSVKIELIFKIFETFIKRGTCNKIWMWTAQEIT